MIRGDEGVRGTPDLLLLLFNVGDFFDDTLSGGDLERDFGSDVLDCFGVDLFRKQQYNFRTNFLLKNYYNLMAKQVSSLT